MRLASPRLLPLAAVASLLVLPAADAQRRSEPVGGTDLQILASGLTVDGVGMRFWLTPQTALAIRADVGFENVDGGGGNDDSRLDLGLGVTIQNHAFRRSRVHPFVLGGVSVRHSSVDRSGTDTASTTFGVEAGIGASAQLMQALALSGQYTARVGFTSGDGADRLALGLGGVPRLALSFRF